MHRTDQVDYRAVPVSFRPAVLPRKPRRNASDAEIAAYKTACQQNRMCVKTLEQLRGLRRAFDRAGAAAQDLIAALDGGFCNRTMFRADLERTELIARCRKDAVLCFPADDPACPRRFYGTDKFTPEQVLRNEARPWKTTALFVGGRKRPVRYKELTGVLWQGGARRRRLRLLVLAPTPYRLSPHSRANYRQPAYLLTTDLTDPPALLLQCYVDRWQIEVNHRDEKQHIGLTDPQVWNDASVDRQPAFMVASYSFLLLAALLAYGPRRTQQYIEPPKWQRRRTRPSCQDLLALIRTQAAQRDGPPNGSMPFTYSPAKVLARAAA